MSSSAAAAAAHRDTEFDLRAAWRLNPLVALRPEAFGALAYHFGTRRLSFLKSPGLRAVVESLAEFPSADAALVAAGIGAEQKPVYVDALATLATTDMIVRGDQL